MKATNFLINGKDAKSYTGRAYAKGIFKELKLPSAGSFVTGYE